ncbi:LPXTG cell wall anchor domain-containing protein [Enterococcus gallinarum]|uniref:LPXTG cell wall anchor domain-containing protein n=1 Tax=Enterococcus gallinarum TaxID=1353 RepID=UPI0028907B9E|nr:LPXTG cell wall anchor domain-containing protein [Enterococcus gallinarum]MDT2684654.1 LPXTG cell wall anchor domain-containing protein [Enterococcus gallinarum]
MKKILFLSLFSTTILLGTAGVAASAEEATTDSSPAVEIPSNPVVPSEPTSTTPSVEPPTDPVVPPTSGGESQPTVPDTPEVPVTPPSESSEGGETLPTNPTDSGTTTPEQPGATETSDSATTDSSTTEQPTTPSSSEESTETSKEESNKSAEEPGRTEVRKETSSTAPAKEVTVSVNASGGITTDASQETSVPIVTSNVKEISHVPTPTTPLKVATGQTIVGVKDGVPLVQDAQGNLVEDQSIPVKKLPSGNIEVKTADGKTKVLPKTGEEMSVFLSAAGGILSLVSGFVFFKKRQSMNNG